jgi:hypothetical protein
MAPVGDSLLERWAYAGVAGVVSEFATYPLDMIKTRLQLQNEIGKSLTGGAATTQLSYTQMARAVVATEGATALYAGATVAIVRQIFNAGVSVGLYGSVREALLGAGEDAASVPLWKRVLAGGVSGSIAQAIANPADVVKVRVQADGRLRMVGKAPRYAGALDATRKIWAAEGAAGFYTAVGSSVWRAAIINAAGISSYDHTKQLVIRVAGSDRGLLPQLVGSLVTGVVSAVVSAPLDIVKTRMMNNPAAYRGPNDCLRQLIANEGLLSAYKGFLPTYKRQVRAAGRLPVVGLGRTRV